jgi:putative transposase
VGLQESTAYYPLQPKREETRLRDRLIQLAQEKTRYGRPQLIDWLRREGFTDNHKRIARIYREQKLQIYRRKGKKKRTGLRLVMPVPQRPNERWSMDFVTDSFSNGRRFRVLTIVDDCTRECLALYVDTGISGERVSQVLDEIAKSRPLPKAIVTDNGPEFISKAMDQWAYKNSVDLKFIQPGKPVQNAFIESFNGKFRFQCLDAHWFEDLYQARQIIGDWRTEYNTLRFHSSLGRQTPQQFAERFKNALCG